MTETIRILGIDPGTATTGWAVIEKKNSQVFPIAYGHISTSPKKSSVERLQEIEKDLKKILSTYTPHEGAVEKLFFFKNQKTIIDVAQARGVILLALSKKIPLLAEYTPLQIKQALTGYGRADKNQIQQMVKTILSLSEIPRPDDTADALAVALCHLHSRNFQSLV